MSRLIALNKPYGTLCQFSGEGPTLADLIPVPEVYPAGRLDKDSEGLLLLTDDGRLQARIADPRHREAKAYLVQVEGAPDGEALAALSAGPELKDGPTRRCEVALCEEPAWLWERDPPIRVRQRIPTSWLTLTLREGRNRQVRRMTAAVGHPTLRLVRRRVAGWDLAELGLGPGEWCELAPPRPGDQPATRSRKRSRNSRA